MSNLTLFLACLLVTIGDVTYALMRLAPTAAPLPRGAIPLIRAVVRNWYALGILLGSALGGLLLYWAITAYPIATGVAAVIAISAVIAVLVIHLNK